ncbi:MAG: T9SS type A sorting domain-containing protein, partial [Bacteroidales bacterium]|nr:T9SS type A sorting domain-containing protein [Bacteroidales bacterium]
EWGTVSGGGEYEHFQTVNLLATPANGYEFQHWKEDDNIVMDANGPAGAAYSFPAVNHRSLIAYFQVEGTSIPVVSELDNHLIQPNDTQCFNATQSIYTAGNGGHFIVENGGTTTLIAGEKIVMLPGTKVFHGGHMHAYIAPGGPFCIEPDKHYTNLMVQPDETLCLDATQTIHTAGDGGHFIVSSGGAVTLIAGEKIVMQYGTQVESGGYLHAYIAPGGPFCGEMENHFLVVNDPVEAEADPDDTIIKGTAEPEKPASFFKLYPNPVSDILTVELCSRENHEMLRVEIFNIQGELILSQELPPGQKHEIGLRSCKPGVYLVRLVNGAQIGIEKLIKQ